MAAAALCAAPTPQRYRRRRPERTLWYRIFQFHLETWLELASGEDGEAPPAYVERTFRHYLECGILAHGFARDYCDECQHDFLIAYSCKCRSVCPSCNMRRMAEAAAHLVDHVFPPLPVRQWALAVPKRLCYFLQRDTALQGKVLRIFLSVVERCLREHSPACPAAARVGAVAFIHRFGSSLNEHVHFHCYVIDGVLSRPSPRILHRASAFMPPWCRLQGHIAIATTACWRPMPDCGRRSPPKLRPPHRQRRLLWHPQRAPPSGRVTLPMGHAAGAHL